MTTQIWSRFPTLAGFLKRIIVLHRVGDRCQRSCFLVGSIFSWAGTMNRLWDLYEFSDFLAPLVLSDLQVKLVPVMPCALCTPQILYRLSRSSYSNLNDPDPLPPQRFCIVSHSTYSNLKRRPAGGIAWLSFVQKIHHQRSSTFRVCKSTIGAISYLQSGAWWAAYTNVIWSIKCVTWTWHKKHSWLEKRTTNSR